VGCKEARNVTCTV